MAMNRILIVAMMAAAAWGQSGNISGRVLDERGRDYAQGARVLAVLLPEKPEGFTPFVTNAVTTPEGRFQMVGVPVGKYELCVQALNTDYVDMCRWGRVAANPVVVSGQTATANLTLTRGKEFTVEVEDKEGLFERHEGRSPGGFLAIGVFTPQREFVDAQISQDNKVKRVYRAVVPVGQRFQVRVVSPLFDVVNENEEQEPLRVVQDLNREFAEAENSKGIKLKVQGLKKLEVGR